MQPSREGCRFSYGQPIPRGGLIANVTALNPMSRLRHALIVLQKIAAIIWASPYSIIGLLIGCIGILFGGRVRIVGPAIEFYDGGIKWFVHRLPTDNLLWH